MAKIFFSAEVSRLLYRSHSNVIKLNAKYISSTQHEKAEYRDKHNMLRRSFLFTDELASLLNVKKRGRDEPLLQSHKNIAKSTQAHFEKIVIKLLNDLQKEINTTFLATAGGCALNGVTNSRILRDTQFEANYIQPAASDDGLAIGAALYCWHNFLNRTERFQLNHAYGHLYKLP